MSRLVVGLESSGHQFMNDVILYCQVTGHENRLDLRKQIYQECISQIFGVMDVDFQAFLANLMMLPAWSTIHYLEGPVNYDIIGDFRNAVRAMGISIWHRLSSRNNLDSRYFYTLESCTEDIAIVALVIDSALV